MGVPRALKVRGGRKEERQPSDPPGKEVESLNQSVMGSPGWPLTLSLDKDDLDFLILLLLPPRARITVYVELRTELGAC